MYQKQFVIPRPPSLFTTTPTTTTTGYFIYWSSLLRSPTHTDCAAEHTHRHAFDRDKIPVRKIHTKEKKKKKTKNYNE